MPRVIDIYSCGGFNRGLKKLQKHRKQSLLLKLNRIIDELRDFKVGNKYHNHKLSGSDYFELHVDGDILLVYKYVDSESGLKLELFNLTDHDRLNQSIRGDDRLNIKKRKVYSSIYKDYTDYFRVEYRGNGYAIHSTPVDNRPEADSRKLFEDFRATVGVSNPYDDADYYWARIQDGIIEFIKDGKVDRDETEFYYDADDMDEENSDWCGVIIDIAVQKLDRLNKDIKPRIIHNSVTVKYKSAVKGSNYGEKYGSANSDYVGYNYLGDYITENYEGDLDDRYGCIDSLRESFKNEEKVAKDIIREFAYAHNLDDVHAEPEAVKGAGTIKTIKELERKLYDRAKKEMISFGFPSLEVGDYLFVETRPVDFDDGTSGYRVEVRAELGYDDMYDLVSALDPIIMQYDEYAYFDMDEPGIASGYVRKESDIKDPYDVVGAEEITSEDPNDFELGQVEQEYTSKDTSINSTKLPAIYRLVNLYPGELVLDYGGGKFDIAAEEMAKKDVTVLIYDPYNRSSSHNNEVIKTIRSNGGSDVTLCSNVLNVIKEPEARLNVLKNIAKLTSPGGDIYITVYEGSGKGNEGATKSGYQLNKKTADYMDEVQSVFPDAVRKGKLIHATNSGVTACKMDDAIYDITSADDVGYTSYSDPRLQPPEGEEYHEVDAYDDEVEIEFDTEITVEPGGNWDFNNTDYSSWMEGMNVVGDNIYGNEEDVVIDDADGVADKIFDLTSMNIPIVPGRYRMSGIADLFYHVSGVEYDDEGTAYADKADIDYEYKKSSVRNLQVEKLD